MSAPPAFHARPGREVAEVLGSDPGRGLDPAEAAARREREGPNRLPEPPAPSRLAVLARQFANSMVVLLIAAGGVSLLVGEALDAGVILALVVVNAALGYLQEERAERSAAALRALMTARARVVRAGAVREIDAEEIVAGDIVLVGPGDRVPADARILDAAALEVDESALTGESLPVAKRAEPPVEDERPLAERETIAYAGTTVGRGTGRLVVTATGARTEFGRIAAGAESTQPTTPLQARLAGLSRMILRSVIALCVVLAGLSLAYGGGLAESLLVGVSLAVAAVPEGLPAVVTVALALGMRHMARHGAIVRRLHAVETLGSATVICSDKTGTLTRNELEATHLYAVGSGSEVDLTAGDLGGRAAAAVLSAAAAASETVGERTEERSSKSDPIEAAIAAAVAAVARDGAGPPQDRVVAVLPFDSERKRMAVVRESARGGRTAYVKGAPDVLLGLLAPERRDAALERTLERWTAEGVRVLAVAVRQGLGPDDDPERELSPVGLIGLSDPPRPAVRDNVIAARGAGVRTVMITGDHPATALAIARAVAIVEDGTDGADDRVLTGIELERLSADALAERARSVAVYARVVPHHKVAIVEALQRGGEVVAMTGDGVNDVPALGAAHIGVAMGRRGTDAAIDTGDMVLADDDYSTIVRAIERGRSIYDNIVRFVHFLLAANAGEVLVFALAVLLGLGAPLTVLQVLVVNLLTDGLPALALAGDPPSSEAMKRPPRPVGESVLRPIRGRLLVGGIAVGLSAFAAFLIGREESQELAQTMAFATVVYAQLAHVFATRGDGWLWQAGRNLALIAAVAASAAIGLALLALPPLREGFGVAAMDPGQLAWVIGLSLVPVTAVELLKASERAQRRRAEARAAGSPAHAT